MTRSPKPFSRVKAGILNFISVITASFFTFLFTHVGFDPNFDISFIGLGMKIAAVVTPLLAILMIYLTHKKNTYGLAWLGIFLPLLVFMLTFFIAGTIDAIMLSGSAA